MNVQTSPEHAQEFAEDGWITPYIGMERLLSLTPARIERNARRCAPQDLTSIDRLYAAWVLLLTRGLRRGELAGLRWDRVDLDAARLQITGTHVSVSGRVGECVGAKTSARRRPIPLDAGLLKVLRAHHERQFFEEHAWGASWQDSGYVIVREDGWPYHPKSTSQRFDRLCARAKVWRIRLHDLRHTAATLMLEGGTPVKVAAEMLGHSNPAVTQATYQRVLPGMAAAAGERLSGRPLGGAS